MNQDALTAQKDAAELRHLREVMTQFASRVTRSSDPIIKEAAKDLQRAMQSNKIAKRE